MLNQKILVECISFCIFLFPICFLQAETVSAANDTTLSASSIVEAQKKLVTLGFLDAQPSGAYDAPTINAVKLFQGKYGLTADGWLDLKTLAALDSALNARSATPSRGVAVDRTVPVVETGKYGEYIDWAQADGVFKIGSIVKVTDFKTGKTFNVKRTYGHNHADCEPLTKEDTAIMLSIWGKWSWATRAVIIDVNGRRLAASMSALPHAGLDSAPANATVSNRSGSYGTGMNLDAVKGNNFDGHFDIHFLNSKTHASNKINPEHQKCVKIAAGK